MAKSSTRVIAGKSGAKSKPAPPVTRLSISNGPQERSVEVRKIENGYIIRESSYGGKGGYKSCERFSPTAPKIDVPAMPKAKK